MKDTVLVTGGTGFVGIYCILQLLQKGYTVKTTLRSMKRKDEVLAMLKNGGITSYENLEFIEADLLNDANWDEATEGCTYVLHVASPMPPSIPKDENELIRPAVGGTLRVLKASKAAGVKRVVVTSSFVAVGYSHKDPNTVITEKDWTNPDQKGLVAYHKSKVLGERAAWDFIEKEGGDMELVVINPVFIQGPSLGPDFSGSFHMLEMLLKGGMKAVPNINFNVIDVRDVADLHIRAMTNPEASGQRFIGMAGGSISFPQIAELLKRKLPGISQKVPVKVMPDWIVRVGALFNAQARAISSTLGVHRNVSNEKAKKILGWKPIATNEEAIIATAESMAKFGALK